MQCLRIESFRDELRARKTNETQSRRKKGSNRKANKDAPDHLDGKGTRTKMSGVVVFKLMPTYEKPQRAKLVRREPGKTV